MSRVAHLFLCLILLIGIGPRGEARPAQILPTAPPCSMPCCQPGANSKIPCCCNKPSGHGTFSSELKNCGCQVASLPLIEKAADPATVPTVPTLANLAELILVPSSQPEVSVITPHLVTPRIRAPERSAQGPRAPPAR